MEKNRIAIINSGANINSLLFAIERLGRKAVLTTDANEIKQASHVILPGVGAAAMAMQGLKELHLIEIITNLTQPVLGICLGMQLLYEFSTEGDIPCLHKVSGRVEKLKPEPALPVPHMGWNKLEIQHSDPLFKGIPTGSYVYFTHSYAAPVTEVTTAIAHYNQAFSAAMQDKNFFATQFHPEKSGEVGGKF